MQGGDTEWITIDDETNYDDIIFHNDELYGFSSGMSLSIFDVSSWIPKLTEVIPFPKGRYGYFWSYLVEHCGQILLILRRLKWDENLFNLPEGWRGNKIYFKDNVFDFLREDVKRECDFGIYDMVEKYIYRFDGYSSN